VAVVGTGVGGLAIAGHAGLVGCEVAVHDVREEAVAPVRHRGGIEVRGKEAGFVSVDVATTEVGRAVAGADVVVIATQGPDQRAAATSMAPHLRDGQVVLVKPGCTFGAIDVRAALDLAGTDRSVAVAETDSFAYGCAIPEPGVAEITSVKRRFGVAVLPNDRSGEVLGIVRSLFEQAEPATSVLHTGLANMNAILHVAPMVLNAGWIESEYPFDFYGEGITRSVADAVRAMDDERVAVARALQIAVPTIEEWAAATYGVRAGDTHDVLQTLHHDVYGPLPAPTSLRQRYLTEDVPCGAVPVADLGAQIGVPTPVTASSVTIADALLGASWRTEGRTMERLGLSEMTAEEIRDRLT
jgi:opine dehydrogenase